MPSFFVEKLYAKTRLDQYLVERTLVYSRTVIQRAIQDGLVTVNGKKMSAHYAVRFKDKIIFEEKGVRNEVAPQPNQMIHRPRITAHEKPRVIKETPQYYVIDKPAGWLMHAASGSDRAPLISDFVLELDPTLSVVGDNPQLRPGIVHRLDKDVSGLVVIARTQSFFDHVKNQFIERSVRKTYKALVFGHPTKNEDDITFRIGRSSRFAKMAARPSRSNDGKEAITHFQVAELFQHSSLLTVWVETGRTNQIRAHLAAYNLPIVGDVVYGKKTPANSKVGRVMLHADYLEFFDVSGVKVSFESPLPVAFESLLTKARGDAALKRS